MTQRIPNSILTENEFADLTADELANYVDSHINNYFNFTGSDKQFIKTKEKKWPPFKLKCPAATSLGLTANNCSQGEAASTYPTTTVSTFLGAKGGQFTDDQKQRIEENLLSGQYETIHEMAMDINDGVPSKIIEDVIFKNMMKMLQKFNE